MKKELIVLTIGTIFISGCTTINPVTNVSPTAQTQSKTLQSMKRAHSQTASSVINRMKSRNASRSGFGKLTSPCEPGCN